MFYIKNFNSKVRLIAISSFMTLVLGFSVAVSAGVVGKDEIRKEFDKTFYQMLEDPSDVNVTMHYAKLAAQLEDYEAAIPALERILLFNPELPRIKQELGVLYYRLDSFDMAKAYLEDAKGSKDAPEDVVRSANKYLDMIN